jgi:hypothetical protein
MSEQTEAIEPDSAPPAPTAGAGTATAATAAAEPAPSVAPAPRRSITLPLLPVAIVGGVIVALLFFGGGVAIGYGVASHDGRSDNAQRYRGGNGGYEFGNGNGNGFPSQNQGGQNQTGPNQGGQNQGGQNQRPGDRPTTAPNG